MTVIPRRAQALVAASILDSDLGRLADEVRRAQDAGADRIHLDVMDDHFVPNITFGWKTIEALRRVTALPFDAHLMIAEPGRWIDEYLDAGCDSITFHVEVEDPIEPTLRRIRAAGDFGSTSEVDLVWRHMATEGALAATFLKGTTANGGQGQVGTIFQVTTNGALTNLVTFYGTNGANPYGGLALGPDGAFYGTASAGGDYDAGTVYRLLTNGDMNTLVSFNGTNGSSPSAGHPRPPEKNNLKFPARGPTRLPGPCRPNCLSSLSIFA